MLLLFCLLSYLVAQLFQQAHQQEQENKGSSNEHPDSSRLNVGQTKVKSKDLAQFGGITEQNLSLLKSGKVKEYLGTNSASAKIP